MIKFQFLHLYARGWLFNWFFGLKIEVVQYGYNSFLIDWAYSEIARKGKTHCWPVETCNIGFEVSYDLTFFRLLLDRNLLSKACYGLWKIRKYHDIWRIIYWCLCRGLFYYYYFLCCRCGVLCCISLWVRDNLSLWYWACTWKALWYGTWICELIF